MCKKIIKYAVLDKDFNEIVEYGVYHYIDGFVKGLARVKKDNKWGIINKTGYKVLETKFDDIWNIKEDMATTKVIYEGEEFYLKIDRCPQDNIYLREDYMLREDVQILFKYRNRQYKKIEYPEIDVYDLDLRWKEEQERREWAKIVDDMRLDAFEGDEDLYDEWRDG